MGALKEAWRNNGTKWIGRAMWIIGFLGTADAGTVNAIKALVGDKYAHFVGPIILICAGLVTEWRSRKNAAEIAAEVIRQQSSLPANPQEIKK